MAFMSSPTRLRFQTETLPGGVGTNHRSCRGVENWADLPCRSSGGGSDLRRRGPRGCPAMERVPPCSVQSAPSEAGRGEKNRSHRKSHRNHCAKPLAWRSPVLGCLRSSRSSDESRRISPCRCASARRFRYVARSLREAIRGSGNGSGRIFSDGMAESSLRRKCPRRQCDPVRYRYGAGCIRRRLPAGEQVRL